MPIREAGHAVTYWNNGAQEPATAGKRWGSIERLILLEDDRSRADWKDELTELSGRGERDRSGGDGRTAR
jgi:hypothetical protein